VSAAEWSQVRLWKNGQPSPSNWTPSVVGETGAKYQSLIDKGTTTYLSPRIVIKHTYTSSTIPSLAQVGRINFPSFAGGITPPGVDFILTGASAVQEGSYYKISLEWLGSAFGGWDKNLYYGTT